jgi:hypothetical protein
VSKNAFQSKAGDARKVKRPIMRWLEDPENDLPELKMKR